MIPKKTEKAIREATKKIYDVMHSNRLKAHEQIDLITIHKKLQRWLEYFGRNGEENK